MRQQHFTGRDGTHVFLAQPGAQARPPYQDALDKMLGEIVANDSTLSQDYGMTVQHRGQGGEDLVSAEQAARMVTYGAEMREAFAQATGRRVPVTAPNHVVTVVHDAPCTARMLAQGYCGGCICERPEVRLVRSP
jgi:hypothetical protein